MEELGIGRPSTYSSIISKLKENYVRLENRRFYPEGRSRLVTAFLVKFFSKYVEYDFTAELEEKLDDISGGHIEWKSVLQDFWTSFSEAINETSELRNREVLDALNELLGPHFFRTDEEGGDPRKCPNCKDGRLSFKSSHKHGGFIGCTNYPECNHTRPLTVANGLQPTPALTDNGPKELGIEPKTGFSVSLRRGPYGFYIQLGEPEGKIKPKRASLTKDMDPNDVDLKLALDLLALPREVGLHPETADMITAAIGRFGPYVKMGGTYVSLKEDNVLEIGLNRAVALLADAPRRPAPVEVGPHPKDKKPITLRQGRFGLYVQHGNVRATLPKENDKETIDLELAIELIEAKTAKKKTTTTKKASSKKRATKKKAVTAKTQH
jgi:DNA topoisomerase-1